MTTVTVGGVGHDTTGVNEDDEHAAEWFVAPDTGRGCPGDMV